MATCPTCRNEFTGATFCPRDGARLVDGAAGRLLGGRYRLLRKVGEGGMGVVFEAEHVYIKRRVAVKILRDGIASDAQAIERLQREAESTSGLGHPHIVDSIDFGYSEDGQVYLVMEWLDGENLEERLHRGPLEIRTALEVAAQACSGLAEAHAHGVIHRDLKPANLFLTHDRAGELLVKVLDFGIAKLAVHQTKLTGTGMLVGTPNYMAPEQALGDDIDERTDVYAVGVILYEMLAGVVPFVAETSLAVLHQQTTKIPAPPSLRAPDRGITTALDAVVMRCLAKRPADRYPSMVELAAALHAASTGPRPTAAEVEDEDDETPRPRTRRWWILGVGVAVVAASAATMLWYGGRGRSARVAAGAVDANPADAPAAPFDAAVTAADAGVVGWLHHARTAQFSYQATVTPDPIAQGRPFELVIAFSDLGEQERAALVAGELAARIRVAYYLRDASFVHVSSHAVDPAGYTRATITLEAAGKHHVTLDLVRDGERLDGARFDIQVQPGP